MANKIQDVKLLRMQRTFFKEKKIYLQLYIYNRKKFTAVFHQYANTSIEICFSCGRTRIVKDTNG